MANTISSGTMFNKMNTTSSDFKILTGIDKVYSNQLPKKEEMDLPDNKEDC
jgi:hypothetical protein